LAAVGGGGVANVGEEGTAAGLGGAKDGGGGMNAGCAFGWGGGGAATAGAGAGT
jgi:hypothetical protein